MHRAIHSKTTLSILTAPKFMHLVQVDYPQQKYHPHLFPAPFRVLAKHQNVSNSASAGRTGHSVPQSQRVYL